MFDFGPTAVFLAVVTGSTMLALAATGAVFLLVAERTRAGWWRRTVSGCLIGISTFLLWGSSSGRGGPDAINGTTAVTDCGLINYVVVTSDQPARVLAGGTTRTFLLGD